jgi:DNA-binding FadR family transcriptional regulator
LREITMVEDALRALSARLAAEKATAAQLEEMRVLLDSADDLYDEVMGAEAGSSTQRSLVVGILDAMRRFHSLVDRASANPTLIQMLRMVDAFEGNERRHSVLSEIKADGPTVDDRYHQHRAIFEAIAGRDPDRAEDLMRAHSRSSNNSQLTTRFSR